MGKAEAGSAKSIANAIKAKGLGRLRWYCQICEKQCRDENGFQAHIKSEPHLRKILSVGPKAGATIAQFSQNFQYEFVLLLRTRHTTNRVQANKVYNEYIQDKHHVHMNATRWVTLGGFIAHLGKEGIVRVDEDEEGLWVQWIDNSPATLQRQAAIQKRDRAQMDGEERDRLVLQEQIDRARKQELAAAAASGSALASGSGSGSGPDAGAAAGGGDPAGQAQGLLKRDGEKVALSFSFGAPAPPVGAVSGNASAGPSGSASTPADAGATAGAAAAAASSGSTAAILTGSTSTAIPSSSTPSSGFSITPIQPKKPAPMNVFKAAAKSSSATKRAREDDGAGAGGGGGGGGKRFESAAERLMREDQARKAARVGPVRTQAPKSRF